MLLKRLVIGVLLAVFLCSCSSAGSDSAFPGEEARVAVAKRLEGTWRITSYVPATQLAPAFLIGLQADKIVVTFENGRIRSATAGMTLDRAYRVVADGRDTFKVFITDDHGVEYENWGRFDDAGRLIFETKTAPWKGSGVLERRGSAAGAVVP